METQTLGQRLKFARLRAGLTQTEIGKLFGISREAVSLWESDTNSPTADKLGRIAVETQVNAEWLITGRGLMEGIAPPSSLEPLDGQGRPTTQASSSLPIMGTAEGGPDGLVEWNGEVIDRIARPPFLADVKNAYALYVTGSSMKPRYDVADIVYVNPTRPIIPGCYVVVLFYADEGGGTPNAWIKQFVGRNSKSVVLRQFNPQKELRLATKQILSVHRIVGSGEI